MNYYFNILVSLACTFILTGNNKPSQSFYVREYKIQPGVGTEEFIINKTKIKDIESILGKNYSTSQGVVDYFGKAPKFINRLNYEDIGIEFKFYTHTSTIIFAKNKRINDIIFRSPINARTIEGISIGDSSYLINSIYGTQNKVHHDTDFDYYVYLNKGLTFAVNTATSLIEEIIIHNPVK